MTPEKRQERASAYGIRRRAAVWIALVVMGICSLVVIRGILLDNAGRMGREMAYSYSVEGARNLIVYETMMRQCTRYIDQQLAQSNDPEAWIRAYLENVSTTLGEDVIDPYVVIDGEIVAANPWEGDRSFDIEGAVWYQKALEADGEIIFTDGYRDSISGRIVVTLAQETQEPGNVVAFDIFPENLSGEALRGRLPEGYYYYLCDSSGALLYKDTGLDVPDEVLQGYLDDIISDISPGREARYQTYTYENTGEKRAAYYDVADNGWISIITMPYRSLIGGVRTISLWYAGILLVFLAFLIVMGMREYAMDRNFRRTNDTVRALGNSYYAIYRVDFAGAAYDMIKGSDYVRQRIPAQGPYELLMQTMGEVMQPEVFEDFRRSFSINNIRSLVKTRTRDYGGDFQRLFGTEYRWVNVRLLFDESLNPDEAVLCFREVDEEKREQLQHMELLKEALKTARKSGEDRNAFFSHMSHDMRTPLNAIIGLSELAGRHVDAPEKMQEYMGKINYSSRQLLGLINDILEMSRLESGKVTLENSHFNLRACITDCAELFRSQAEQEGKHFSEEIELETEEVYGDSSRLTQILNNILSNAVKFTPSGGSICLAVCEIEHQEYTKYRITVSDTGAGMSEEFLERIFVPYEREVRFGARNVSGTGLGMPIVKNLITQMDGEISVESQLGKGTVFTVTLPFMGMEQGDAARQRAGTAAEEEPGTEADPGSCLLTGKRVLIAEDNEINMEIACELLDMYGAETIQAWNGQQAVELFRSSAEGEFDVILMDMQMPVMDGCEAARAIRRLHRKDAATVPIIAVTANAFAEDLAATAAAGMNAHISKPIDFRLLCRTLAELPDGRQTGGGGHE